MTQVADGFFPWDAIPDSGVLPDGAFQARGESLEVTVTSTGKKMYSMQGIVEQPEEYSGMRFFENFVIGMDDDPMATQESTWKKSVGARRLKQLLKAASVPVGNSEAQLCAGFAGVMFVVQASQYTEQSGDYAGTVRNRFNFYPIGGKQIGVSGKPAGARGALPTATAPSTPPPAPPTPAAPATPTEPQAIAPEPVQETVTPASDAMIPCGNCGQQVPVNEFGVHVQNCLKTQA